MGEQQPPGRDPRLALFASGGKFDGACPSAQLLDALESLASLTGPGGARFAGSTHDEDAGILAAAQSAESHATWLKLAAIRQIIRRHGPAGPGGALPGPEDWDDSLSHDVATVLRISWQAAVPLIDFAWQLGARLPLVDAFLSTGVLTYCTARIIVDEFSLLDAEQVIEAERRLMGHDLGADDLTPGALRRLCQRIAAAVDPGNAARRRKQKERDARLDFFRDPDGTMSLSGSGLPADQTLRADARVRARVKQYRQAGIKERADFLRAQAWLDLVNGVTAAERHARWTARQDQDGNPASADDPVTGTGTGTNQPASDPGHGDDIPFPDEPEDLDDRFPADHGDAPLPEDPDCPPAPDIPDDPPDDPDGHGDGPAAGAVPAGDPDPGLPAAVNLTLPLATVLGQAARPGEAPGFGALDPGLVRQLAGAAAENPRSAFCVTFTSPEGFAQAHGCARLIRSKAPGPADGTRTRDGPPGTGWDFTRDTTRTGPEGGYGAWTLRLPSGARYRVDLHPVPLEECDHKYETGAYRPGHLLRHLVEIRDGECTAPCCSHPARLSDFEHAFPWHTGGKTCACNAGMRSRRCHRVKQSRGVTVTQPKPGWHRWTMPSGRSYTKGPKRWPA